MTAIRHVAVTSSGWPLVVPGPRVAGHPAAGGGLDDLPSLAGLRPGGLQGGQSGGQVPDREGLAGGLGDCHDISGGDDRVRPRRGAGCRFPAAVLPTRCPVCAAPSSAASSPVVARAGHLGGRGVVIRGSTGLVAGRWVRAGAGSPTGFQVSGCRADPLDTHSGAGLSPARPGPGGRRAR